MLCFEYKYDMMQLLNLSRQFYSSTYLFNYCNQTYTLLLLVVIVRVLVIYLYLFNGAIFPYYITFIELNLSLEIVMQIE